MVDLHVPTAREVIARDFRRWLPLRGLAAFAGAWGMVNGFALFVEVEHNIHVWYVPVIAVTLASIAAAVVEWLRSSAEGHRFAFPTVERALSFFVLLIVFELFISAFHDLSKESEEWAKTLVDIFGTNSLRGGFQIAVFVGLWALIAARLGSQLADAISRMPHLKTHEELSATLGREAVPSIAAIHRRAITQESLWIGLVAGLKAAVLTIPFTVVAYLLIVRLGWAFVESLITGEWRLPEGETVFGYFAAAMIVGFFAEVITDKRFGLALFAALYIGLNLWNWYAVNDATPLNNLVGQLVATARLTADIAIIWAAPAIVLGAFAPFLRRPSEYPWLWSPLALAAAIAATGLVLVQRDLMTLLLAGGLFAIAWYLRRRSGLDDLWPLLAATVATVAALAMAVVLQLAPFAVYRSIHAAVIPLSLDDREREYLKTPLASIDELSCPKARMEQYDVFLANIARNASSGWPGYSPRPDTDALLGAVKERRGIDAAAFEGRLETPCPGEAGEAHETRSLTRATTFSLATVSALAFWLTLGMLAVWQTRRERPVKG